jgi:tripartite-type tricarboxylate transporter receptor subunit TctC
MMMEGSIVASMVRIGALVALLAVGFMERADAEGNADFYNQKTVKFVVTYAPGGSYDIYARLVSSHLGKHIPGHPSLNVQYMPGAGGLNGTMHLYENAARDGTEIGILPRDIAINQMLRPQQAKYDARRFNWIGVISSYAGVMFVASRTGVKTAADLRRLPVIVGSWGQTTETFITPTLLNALADTKFKVVTGYRGGPEVDLAVERGEVDARMASWTLLKSQRAQWLKDNFVVTPFQSGTKSHPELKGVPLVSELATSEEGRRILEFQNSDAGIGWSVVAPPGVPAERVAVLRAAFDKTMADPEFLAEAKKRGFEINPATGQELEAIVARTMSTPASALVRLKQILGTP